jgi:hypothetical protein
MFVLMKNESGGFSVRPAYIGFIKNTYLRRLLFSLFLPITILVTLVVNLLQATFTSFIMFIKAIWFAFMVLKNPIWKSEIWHRPRSEKDENKRMN